MRPITRAVSLAMGITATGTLPRSSTPHQELHSTPLSFSHPPTSKEVSFNRHIVQHELCASWRLLR